MPAVVAAPIQPVANALRSLPHVVGVALGGSRALGVDDEHSDVEIYVYTHDQVPASSDVASLVNLLGAQLSRSDQAIWNMKPWGPHTFICVSGVSFEIGYRTLAQTKHRLDQYLRLHQIHPRQDLHDLAFGHFPSALASCVANSKILWEEDGRLGQLQQWASELPVDLRRKLIEHHGRDAYLITSRKLRRAAARGDVLHFQACAARAMRSLIITMLAVAHCHFPGDKWQLQVLRRANAALNPAFDLRPLEDFFRFGEHTPDQLACRAETLSAVLGATMSHPAFPGHLASEILDGVNW